MKKFPSSTNRKFGFVRLLSITAVVLTAAIFINALPNLSAQAATGGSFFGLAELFSLSATSQPAVEPQTSDSSAPSVVGVCQTLPGGVIEVESAANTTPTGYPTLADAFTAINGGAYTGTITIDVCGDTTEPAAGAILNASGAGAASYTSIAISPAGGAARTISGTATTVLVDLNGADNVTINGLNSGGNALTISNTNALTTSGIATIRFVGDATGNTVTNSTILGAGSASTATNGGTIYFAAGAVTVGNDNNIISNNKIGPSSALPTKAVFSNGTTTSVATYNSGIQITGNEIYDYFGAAVTSAGVYVSSGSTDWTISNNKLYQTATRTQTTGSIHAGIQLASANINNTTVSGNTIGFANAAGTGTYSFVGIGTGSKFLPIYFSSLGTTTASSVTNNIINGINLSGVVGGTGTTGAFVGVSFAAGVGAITGNTVGSLTAAGAISITSNNGSAMEVYGIYYFPSAVASISGNNIGGIVASNTGAGALDIYGIRAFTSSTVLNTMTNNTIGSAAAPISNSNAATGSNIYGLYCQSGACIVTGNIIRNLTMNAPNVGTGSTASGIGLWIDNSSATAGNNIGQNTVESVSNTNATAAVSITGLHYNGATTGVHIVQRNRISGISTPTTTSSLGIVSGINIIGGLTTYQNNMVILGNDMTNSPVINGINETVAGTDNLYHNSVYIGGSPTTGTANSFAFQSSITTNTRNYRNNIFFNNRDNAGATGKHYAIRVGGTTPNPTGLTSNNNDLYAPGTGGFVGLFNAIDQLTLADWQAATGQDAASLSVDPSFVSVNNLHITAFSPVRDLAANVGVTNDFDGQSRPGANALFDIGADEFDGTTPLANDIAATAIVTPANGSSIPTGTVITPQATFTNVGTAAQTNVMVQFMITGPGGYTYSDTQTIATINPGQAITVTFAAATAVAAGGTYNTTATVLTADGNAANNSVGGTFTVPTPIAGGTYNVPGDYPSLTNPGGIFAALNASGASGNIVINIAADLAGETGAVALNQLSAGITVTIKPTGAARTITGTSAGYLISFNGADNVTIDGSTSGGTDRSLTVTNTGGGGGIGFTVGTPANGANSNTVKNVNVFGGSPTATVIGIAFGGNTFGSAGTNINNRVENCDIRSSIYGIYSVGTSAAVPNTGVVLTRNVMTATGAARIGRIGIFTGNDDGVQITENSISGIASAEAADAVAIGAGAQGILTTPPTPISQVNALISRNNVGTVVQTNTYSAVGIILASGATGTNTVVNNFVSGVIGNSNSGDLVVGIYVLPVAGATQNIYYNSVSMTGDRGTTANLYPSFALAIAADQPTNVLNNILLNTQTRTGSTGGGGESVAYGILPATFANLTSNYNDLFVSGPNGVVGLTGGLTSTAQTTTAGTGVVRTTLADFQTATGKDANSVSVDPLFVSDTDLHLQITSPVRDAGTPIAGVTTDIDGNTRTGATDIGADELPPLAGAGTLNFGSATYTGNEGATVTITVNRTTGNAGTVTAQVSITGGTATGGAACTAGVDYINTGFPQTLTFVNGDVTESFNVTLCSDAVLDDNETIIFTLSNPTGGVTIGATNTTTVTINDVAPPLNGTYNVPGNYPSLTNPGGIFEALNNSGANGTVNINITADLTGETGSIGLNPVNGDQAVNIRPTGGARTISSTPTATTLIPILGADNVTIDGNISTPGINRGLTFNLTNTTTSGTTVFFIGSQGTGAGATNFTLQNSTVQAGVNGSDGVLLTFGIFVGDQTGAAAGADNDNLRIQNNLIQRATIGIQAVGTAAGVNNNTVIADNTFGGAAAADFLGQVGINIGQSVNASVTRNIVNNIVTSDTADVRGIILGAGTLNSSVTRNRITNLNATNDVGYGSVGIFVSTGTAASGITIANNFISDIKGTSYTTGTFIADTNAGIMIAGTTGGVNIYYNSVNLFGDYAGFNGATITGALSIINSTVTDLNVRDNIFVNSFNNTTVTTDKNYAIYSAAPAASFTDINYNDYFVSGPQGVLGAINAVDVTTLAALQAATGKDANSISGDPLFVSPTDLHIVNPASPVSNAGTPIAGITGDFDNQSRSATTPDIGADEFIFNPTAASVDIGGRVREANGRGIFRTRVTMTDAGGNVRMAFTNQFGYFSFSNVAAGNTYVFSATDRRYQFAEPTQVLFINEATEGINFMASGENPGFRPGATFFDNAPFDFDGDGRTDVSVFRNSDNTWYIYRSSDNTLFAQAFGAAGDRLAPADFDGDRKTDLAVFRASEGNWYIWLSASNSLRVEQFGTELDRAIPADFDGDGKADFSIWNEMRGTWQVKLSTNGTIISERFNNGKGNFTPLASDRNGDGKADFIFFNDLNATWTIRTSSGADIKEQFGAAGDRAATGDFDGDGQGDLAVYRASENTWTIKLADGKELTDLRLSANANNPVLGDFDGDGRADAAGFGNGVWSVRQSVNGAVRQQQFGLADDTVIPSVR